MSSQGGVAPQPCDNKFMAALETLQDAAQKMSLALHACILTTARTMATVGGSLGGENDTMVTRLVASLRSAVAAKNVPDVGRALKFFLGDVDRNQIDFRTDMPYTNFMAAIIYLSDAVEEWATTDAGKMIASQQDTVRCRSYLNRLLRR